MPMPTSDAQRSSLTSPTPYARRTPWFDPPATRGHRLTLICFPYAGGAASAFRDWQPDLPGDVRLCPVHLPGRGKRFREAPVRRLNDLVDMVGPALIPLLDTPFAFFGHSMGALLAFEVTRWLRREGSWRPEAIHLSGSRPPDARVLDDPPSHALPETEFIARLRELNGTPVELLDDAEARALLIPVLRADFESVHHYEYIPEAPLAIPIYVYGGLRDAIAPAEALTPWSRQTTGPFACHHFNGGHFYIQECRGAFMERLSVDLARNQAR